MEITFWIEAEGQLCPLWNGLMEAVGEVRLLIGTGGAGRCSPHRRSPEAGSHKLVIGEMLVGEAHPFEEFAILGKGVGLALAEALDIMARA
jgi:hypothetical protein